MIWNNYILPSDSNVELLTEHIAAEIKATGFSFSDDSAAPAGDELARAVAEFVSIRSPAFPKDSAERDNGVTIPSDYLLIMICRALWAVGHEDAARTLLREKGPELGLEEPYADAVFAENLFPLLGLHASLIRALRPSSAPWSLNGPCWILNLRAIFSFLGPGLELAIWRIMHALIKQLAVLWDVSGGKGVLGLKGLHYVSDNVLGFHRKSKQGRRFASEMIAYCEQDLKFAAEERNWRSRPAIMDINS